MICPLEQKGGMVELRSVKAQYIAKHTGRYGNEVTCWPPTLTWYPSTPARKVKINNLPSAKGKGHVIAGFFARPMNLCNHEVVLDPFESTISLRAHFSHLSNPSTVQKTFEINNSR